MVKEIRILDGFSFRKLFYRGIEDNFIRFELNLTRPIGISPRKF